MSRKKNLSIFTIDFGAGGAERVISLLLKHLKDDFKVTLILFYNYIDYDIPDEVNTIVLLPNTKKTNSLVKKIRDMIALLFKYNKVIRHEKIDIAMAFLPVPNIINGITRMRNKKLKTIISERCFPSIMYTNNKFSLRLAKFLFPLFYNKNHKLFSNSIHINNDLKQNFKVTIPMSVIYNPIEINSKNIIDSNTIVIKEQFKVINVGTLYAPKNQKLIVNALHLLPKNAYQLTILGEGIFEQDLKQQIQELKLGNQINLKGKVPNVKDYLLQSDCFVLSSNTEGFPNVLLEAMSVGLPVISTNCLSGPLELLNDNEDVVIAQGEFYKAKYGLLINTEDTDALSKALDYYYKHPEERKRYSELGFTKAKEYDLPFIYNQVKDLIIS